MYARKKELAEEFSMSYRTVCNRVDGIRKQIGKRYNEYAIIDNLVCKEVFADYEKYHKHLDKKNLAKYVPPFDEHKAKRYLEDSTKSQKKESVDVKECKDVSAVLVVCVDNIKLQKLINYIEKEIC